MIPCEIYVVNTENSEMNQESILTAWPVFGKAAFLPLNL
jgi:hypothetical protein